MPDIDEVWERIRAHQGETFRIMSGDPLVYRIEGERLHHNRTVSSTSKTAFGNALPHVPCDGPSAFPRDKVWGPSYVWAILHDERIRRDDW